MSRWWLAGLVGLGLSARGGMDAERAAVDRAGEELAAGRPAAAARLLEAALRQVTEAPAQDRLRCRLGEALLADDRPGEALRALEPVALDAACGPRAAWSRVEALRRTGQAAAAAELAESLGQRATGPTRDEALSTSFAALGRRLLADPERGADKGLELLALAAAMDVDPAQRDALADEAWAGWRRLGGAAPGGLCAALTASPDRLARAVEVCPDPWLLATGLPPGADRALASSAHLADPVARAVVRDGALAGRDDDDARRLLAQSWAAADALDARASLLALAAPDPQREALLLLTRTARWDAVAAEAAAWRAAWPWDPHRAEVDAQHASALLALARQAAEPDRATALYDELRTTFPASDLAPLAAVEAGLSARRAGRADDARRRWEAVRAAFPGTPAAGDAVRSLARALAFDAGTPEAAVAFLREADDGATELERLRAPGLALEAEGVTRGDPVVRLVTRNLERVELRVHRVDPLAWVRAGRSLEELAALDPAAIAPDRVQQVVVPDPTPMRDRAFEVALKVPGPGVYAVTAASATEEARALVSVADLRVVTRTVGRDTAVAVFDAAGAPVGGARVVLAGGEVVEGRTDRSGLFVSRGSGLDPAVLVEQRGAWVLVPAGGLAAPDAPLHTALVSTELERSVVLPGDRVGFRAVARVDGAPTAGSWTVWLDGAPPVELVADGFGAVTGELVVPVPDASRGPHPLRTERTLYGLLPGESAPRALAELVVADRDAEAFDLRTELDGADLVVHVRDPRDLPAAGVAVEVDGAVAWTDATGTARVAGPPSHLPWAPTARLVGTDAQPARASRAARAALPLAVELEQDLLRPGEAPAAAITGSGPATVTVFRRGVEGELATAPPDPWVPAVDEALRGWEREVSTGVPAPWGPRERVAQVALTLDGEVRWTAEALPEGTYDLVVTADEGRSVVTAPLVVDADRLRARGMRSVGAGDTLHLVPDGGPALLTAEGDGLLWAGVRAEGRPADVPVTLGWRGAVRLAASGPAGAPHVRAVTASPDPVVHLTTTRERGGFRVRAVVSDRAGRPVDAAVSFAAWDPRLAALHGEPPALVAERLFDVSGSDAQWGRGWPLRQGAVGEPIAPALLAEAELQRERERARDADRTGLLSDNALAEALLNDGALELGLGSLGASGYGRGGGSFGSGGLGMVGGAPIVLGGDERPLPGHRERVVWRVEPTVGGVAEVWFPAPPVELELRVSALSVDGVGEERGWLRGGDDLRLVVESPAPGSADDRVRPVATLVNGSSAPVTVPLRFGDAPPEAVTLAPGERVDRTGPAEVAAGGSLVVSAGGLRATFAPPLAEGEPADAGPVTVVAAGPHALTAVTTRDWPEPGDLRAWSDAGRAVVAAHAAAPDPALAARIGVVWATLRAARSQDPTSAAAFLVDARAAGFVAVPEPELRAVLDDVVVQGSAEDRLRAAAVLARGGRPPSAAELERLRADARTGPAARWLGHLLRAVGAPDAPAPSAPDSPPLPGDEALVDWVLAHARDPRGPATVAGVAVPDGIVAVFAGAPEATGPAFVWRGSSVGGEGAPVDVARVPAGPAGRARPTLVADEAGPCDPCRLAVGDRLSDPQGALSARVTTPWRGATSWLARAPGTYRLPVADPARSRPVRVVVGDAVDPASAGLALRVGDDWRDAGRPSPEPVADHPDTPAARLATARFEDALRGGTDEGVATAALELARVDPEAAVDEGPAARAARALRAAGHPEEAIGLWRTIVDRRFRQELHRVAWMEPVVGQLAVLQRTREAWDRYPQGPAVGEVAYLLPGQLLAVADDLPSGALAGGITPTDVRLTAAAWDREFLATFPDHPQATAAGLRLGRTLLELYAPETSAEWTRRVRDAHPGDALTDTLMYLEAVAVTEAGRPQDGEGLLRSLAEDLFPDGDAPPRPSVHADDARLALARLYEARGQWDRAREAWASSTEAEALQALEVLDARRLSAPPVVQAEGGGAAIDVEVEGVETLHLRAYRVDLRTLFLRDGGLGGVHSVAVDGVSPVWTGERRLAAGPFPERHHLPLPLQGAGAWLVQLDGDGQRATTLVVRSDLRLAITDFGGSRRVDVRRGGRPAAGVEVRGWAGGQVFPAVTDVRGVATVPEGAAVLAWDGDSVAFTPPDEAPPTGAAGRPDTTSPVAVVDQQLAQRAQADAGAWEAATRGGVGPVRLGP